MTLPPTTQHNGVQLSIREGNQRNGWYVSSKPNERSSIISGFLRYEELVAALRRLADSLEQGKIKTFRDQEL